MVRTAARKDANQDEIVDAIRAAGRSVATTHQLGAGFPDLCVGGTLETMCPRCKYAYHILYNWLCELKDGDKPPSKKILTPDEVEWHKNWKGQVAVVEDVDDALRLIGALW